MLVSLYRLSNYLYRKKILLIPNIITKLIRFFYSASIPYSVTIGKNISFPHNALGVVINADAKIGDNVKILQNVTIGGRSGSGAPVIKDNVLIGAGSCLLGDIVIGKGAKVGANAVVLDSIPDGKTAVGVPARII